MGSCRAKHGIFRLANDEPDTLPCHEPAHRADVRIGCRRLLLPGERVVGCDQDVIGMICAVIRRRETDVREDRVRAV